MTNSLVRTSVLALLTMLLPTASAQLPGSTATRFSVGFSEATRQQPATGRLTVYLVRAGSSIPERRPPADGPFFEDPQPMFGVDVVELAPGAPPVIVDDSAASFPSPLSRLASGTYRVQAVLDINRLNSNWRREPGNLFSQIQTITIDPNKPITQPIEIRLTDVVAERQPRPTEGVEFVSVRSELLSAFRGRDVQLRAGVVAPIDRDPARSYPTIYVVPGFGGDDTMAIGEAMIRKSPRFQDVPHQILWKNAFVVVLDPEGPNGHHLFANSANNGPVGDALTKELIPALEKKFNLVSSPGARIITGHSSGGWSSVWLQLAYPEVFGACFSSSPDPVDFRHFQLSDLYDVDNWYTDLPAGGIKTNAAGIVDGEIPSYRDDGKILMTVRQENAMEEVLGPDNTSGQQWDSWFATFGPRDDNGNPAALFDPVTGDMTPGIAAKYKAFDLGARLRAEPAKYAPLFRERVHLVVGGDDNYFLNEAVNLLKTDLDTLAPISANAAPPKGTITVVPGTDHGSVQGSAAVRAWPGEMIDFLRAGGYIRE